MRWGRRRQATNPSTDHTHTAATAVLVAGTVLCAVFFLSVADHTAEYPAYPSDRAKEAVWALARDHTSLTDALGIDAYFPPQTVSVGAFEDKSSAGYREFVERGWSFGDYMRDALRLLIGGDTP